MNEFLFNNIAEKWLNQTDISMTSKNTYETLIRSRIMPFWNNKSIDTVSNQLDNYFEWLYSNSLSLNYASEIVIIFNKICKYSFEQGYIDRIYKLKYRKFIKKKVAIFSMDEQNKILSYYLESPSFLLVGVYISLCLGLRIGEVCSLQICDIDFDERILRVTKTVQRVKNTDVTSKNKTKVVVKQPKTKYSFREIPLSETVYQVFFRLFNDCPSENYLITNNSSFIDPRTYENIYKRLLNTLNIPSINYHVLRHTFATMSLQAGTDIKIVSEILGHSDVNTTYNLYVHFTQEYKTSEINKLDEFYKSQLNNFRKSNILRKP